jgi:gamma-glutamyl:cysteine ligase YbdK (ATP-grasp superfamily)
MHLTLHLFEAYGVELEYMIVDAGTLSVRPIADKLLHAVAGEYLAEIELGEIAWSNELAMHVIELKTNGPADSLAGLPHDFHQHVHKMNQLLAPLEARLMPTAMHPWMDPLREMQLWTHDYSPVYEAFNRIFDCRGHGWANLQSVHLNLPFAGDAEFARLHAAIRLLLPILPALAASSPIVERQVTGMLDTRLDKYRTNARRIPSVTGQVIPEGVFSREAYEREILQPIYADLARHDPQGILRFEWANARGAIARFDRNTIEIRVLDVQECPAADIAICAAAVEVLRALTDERWTSLSSQQAFPTADLSDLLLATTCDAEQAPITDRAYLAHFGYADTSPCTAGQLWRHLIETTCLSKPTVPPDCLDALQAILQHGPLARRILNRLSGDTSNNRLESVYRELCDCLAHNRTFAPRPY